MKKEHYYKIEIIKFEYVLLLISFYLINLNFFQIYVEYVVKNTECEMGQPIESELFKLKLDQFIKQHMKSLQ